jgi:sugar phosphate isomerase/epimerase
MRHLVSAFLLLALFLPAVAADPFAKSNLAAWCIVPFDAKKRGPTERVEMLQRLGFTRYVYDWRAEHLPTFGSEVELVKKAGIALQGVWFPAGVGKDGEELLRVLKANDIKTELWVMCPQPDAKLSQDDKVKAVAAQVTTLAKLAAKDGHKVGIYNHGGWTGEPENMAAVVKACGEPNVGIVYNLHHGHDHVAKMAKFADHLTAMKPHLYCLNLSGMKADGEKNGQKILCIGEGDDDAKLLKMIRESGYTGPVGIIGHTDHDVEDRLADNLNGLDCLLRNDGYKPLYRTTGHDRIQLDVANKGQPATFVVSTKPGVREFRAYVAKPNLALKDYENAQPLAGEMKWGVEELYFTPRFPLQPGTTYRVFFDKQTAEFTVPNPRPAVATAITAVYPEAGVLPENTLRMYVHFSRPMKKGDSYKHITLTRDDGVEVKYPFHEIDEGLWTPDGKRLTLLFDPGRVKRGLKPREEEGPILEEGKKYTLTISKDWPDEAGFPLKQGFTKAFSATKPDDEPIDPAKWAITPPNNQARRILPMWVKLSKPLDHALAERLIWVTDAAGKRMDVPLKLESLDTSIQIGEYDRHWAAGKYKLVIDTRLEDVCGNRVGRAFEVDILRPVTKQIETKTVEIPFEVK